MIKVLWNTLLKYSNILLWLIFAELIFIDKHRMVVDITDWHGQRMGESYLVASNFSMTLYAINIVLLILTILKIGNLLYQQKLMQTKIYFVNIFLAIAWIKLYNVVCIKEPFYG